MKKHHLLLIILIVGIAAFFLNDARNLQQRESSASGELKLLREAIKRSPGAATSSSLSIRSPGSRSPVIDPKAFMADLTDILQNGQGAEPREAMKELAEKYEKQLSSAPVSKLKEICELLEKDFPLDRPGSELTRLVWQGVLGMAARSDPAWAFAKFDQAGSTTQSPITAVLGTFKNWAGQSGEPMSLAYAGALQKWLDAAQAAGRIEGTEPLVAELRTNIAAAQGDQSTAIKQISQLPNQSQRRAAIDYVQGLQTPDARRQAMEELSAVLDIQNFPYFVRSLTDQQGFDAAREILSSASLTPENHDMAAASMAAANIGPETPAKAKWLLESLRSEDGRAVIAFMDQWTHADYNGAAQWMNTLPPGERRDAAVAGFAPVAAKIDGASAVDWALTLADPTRREACIADVYRTWKGLDAEAAAAYLKEKGLPVK